MAREGQPWDAECPVCGYPVRGVRPWGDSRFRNPKGEVVGDLLLVPERGIHTYAHPDCKSAILKARLDFPESVEVQD